MLCYVWMILKDISMITIYGKKDLANSLTKKKCYNNHL